ncbi:MAG: transcription termination factor NusA [Planctomycetota bacterium]|nr:MAG: transcription termination factor NusA [Planctomycetota bacterium]
MDGAEILRLVDVIHRDKEIEKEIIFTGIEQALASAAKKKYGSGEELEISIDRDTGEIRATYQGESIDTKEFGRLAALTAKQIIVQKIREAERDVVYREYIHRIGELVTGTLRRLEKRVGFVVSFDKVEGLLRKQDQIPGEPLRVNDTVKAVIIDVKKIGQRTRILLSRNDPDIIRRLFELEVPEIADKTVEIKSVARKPGQRTKIAVSSSDPKVDCLGACVGLRGSRIKGIVEELNGEKIDIVRWNQSPEVFIKNALKPAETLYIELLYDVQKAYVKVDRSQLSLAIGRKGQNVRLVSQLTGWDIDIYSEKEEGEPEEDLDEEKLELEGVKERLLSEEDEDAEQDQEKRELEKLKRNFVNNDFEPSDANSSQ